MLLKLFSKFFKIGLFTFGGGYAMISIVKDEFVSKEKYVSDEEFMNLIAVAEATPGPIAINMATYIGYKVKGMIGAIVATIGVVLPSLIIIYIISLFIIEVLKIKVVTDIFIGISIAVAYIIIRTALSLMRKEMTISDNKIITSIVFLAVLIIALLTDFLSININVIFLIFASIILGIIIYFVNKCCRKNGGENSTGNGSGSKENINGSKEVTR